eukprot:5808503-Pyramimonas_sp.AAC.1
MFSRRHRHSATRTPRNDLHEIHARNSSEHAQAECGRREELSGVDARQARIGSRANGAAAAGLASNGD